MGIISTFPFSGLVSERRVEESMELYNQLKEKGMVALSPWLSNYVVLLCAILLEEAK